MSDSLLGRVNATRLQALKKGALLPIKTRLELLDGEPPFYVRMVDSLQRKEDAGRTRVRRAKDFNPFLPYDPDLYVCDLSDTHVCLLNKFNVMDLHILMVTRAFEKQDDLLTCQDFDAIWRCLDQINGLAFFNGGRGAGASQRHKHLQLIPLPVGPDYDLPFEVLLERAFSCGDETRNGFPGIGSMALPFLQGVVKLDKHSVSRVRDSRNAYLSLLQFAGVWSPEGQSSQPTAPYNLLLTRHYMWLIPRNRECFRGISINALAFAGSLFAKNSEQLALVKETGPLRVLEAVSVTR